MIYRAPHERPPMALSDELATLYVPVVCEPETVWDDPALWAENGEPEAHSGSQPEK